MKRTFQDCQQTAHSLLEGEFENLKHNPADFCRAMGWPKESPGTKKAIKKANDLCWTTEDTDALARIIQNSDEEDLIDIVESGNVQDFLTNCVAGHIQA